MSVTMLPSGGTVIPTWRPTSGGYSKEDHQTPEEIKTADAKLSAIAKEYGVTLDQLIGLAQSGKLNTLEKPTEQQEQQQEGE